MKTKNKKKLSLQEIDDRDKNVYALGSWFYFNSRKAVKAIHDQFNDKKVNLMLDSGVFTFRKKNMTVSTDDYIKFLNNNADLIKYAVTMDYPHDADAIIKNTDYIQARLDPRITLVPVIQSFIFSEEQSEYFIKNWEFICVGTYNGKNKAIMYNKDVQDTLMPIYRLNKKYKKILHGLGRTRTKWLMHNPVQSSDSSGWARYIFTGNTVLWCPDKKDLATAPQEHRGLLFKYEDYYRDRFGVDEDEFTYMLLHPHTLHADSYPHNMLCILAYLQMQEEVRKVNPNYRMFHATSNAKNFRALDKAADAFFNRAW
jgi:hypothetical protein